MGTLSIGNCNVIEQVGKYKGNTLVITSAIKVVEIRRIDRACPDFSQTFYNNEMLENAGGLKEGDLLLVSPFVIGHGRWSWATEYIDINDIEISEDQP